MGKAWAKPLFRDILLGKNDLLKFSLGNDPFAPPPLDTPLFGIIIAFECSHAEERNY